MSTENTTAPAVIGTRPEYREAANVLRLLHQGSPHRAKLDRMAELLEQAMERAPLTAPGATITEPPQQWLRIAEMAEGVEQPATASAVRSRTCHSCKHHDAPGSSSGDSPCWDCTVPGHPGVMLKWEAAATAAQPPTKDDIEEIAAQVGIGMVRGNAPANDLLRRFAERARATQQHLLDIAWTTIHGQAEEIGRLKARLADREKQLAARREQVQVMNLEMSETGHLGHAAVEAECVHMALDERRVPREEAGQSLSLWGRVLAFAATAAQPATLTDEQLIACIRSAAAGSVPMGLLRDRGPYEVTEPTWFARNLADTIVKTAAGATGAA